MKVVIDGRILHLSIIDCGYRSHVERFPFNHKTIVVLPMINTEQA